MAAVQVCVLEMTPSLPASMSVFSASPSRLTSVWISMSAMFVQRIFQALTTLSYSKVTWLLTRPRHSSMPSCHSAWITAMQSSPGRRRWQQTDCNECWTRPHALSVAHGNTITVWRISCTTSSTDLTFQIEWSRPTSSPCHVIGSALTAVGRFLLPGQLSKTHLPMNFVIRNILQTISDSR